MARWCSSRLRAFAVKWAIIAPATAPATAPTTPGTPRSRRVSTVVARWRRQRTRPRSPRQLAWLVGQPDALLALEDEQDRALDAHLRLLRKTVSPPASPPPMSASSSSLKSRPRSSRSTNRRARRRPTHDVCSQPLHLRVARSPRTLIRCSSPREGPWLTAAGIAQPAPLPSHNRTQSPTDHLTPQVLPSTLLRLYSRIAGTRFPLLPREGIEAPALANRTGPFAHQLRG